MEPAPKQNNTMWWVFLTVFIVGLPISWFFRNIPDSHTVWEPGQTVRLVDKDNPKDSTILLCADVVTYDAFSKAAIAKDDVGMRQIVEGGSVFAVTSPTRALVLDYDVLAERVQVRIQDGAQKDHAGWVPVYYLSKM